MAIKKLWFGILVIALVFGVTVVSCDDDSSGGGGGGGESDTWTYVTSPEQGNGTWKGTKYNETINMKQKYISDYTSNGAGATWTPEMENMYNNNYGSDFTQTVTVEIIWTFYATTKIYIETQKNTYAFSGSKVNNVWPYIKSNYADSGFTFDDQKHAMTITETLPQETWTDEYIAELLSKGVQINQNGTKIKVPANLRGSHPAIIFYKQ